MSAMLAIISRDIARNWRGGAWWLPVAFFLLVATLFPFAVGPDQQLLGRVGGGALWIAALLAALLPIDQLVAPDMEAGIYDRMALAGVSDELVIASKLLAHLLCFAVPLMLALLPAAALLALNSETLRQFAIGFAIAAPGLASLSLMIAAISAGQRGGGALAGLMLLPLAVPLLIFGAGMLDPAGRGSPLFLGAVSLLLTAIAPFAGGAALRAARDN
jgi:heme exporter protein B